MSSERPWPTLDLKLLVRYHGIKATQYFAKFTPESENVLRDDLTVLKLPHPKKENMTLLFHGYLECFWPAAAKGGVLHRHIKGKIDPAPETMKQLSISTLTLKEINSHGSKPNELKRPNPYAEQSQSKVPFPFKRRPAFTDHQISASTIPKDGQRDPQHPSKFARVEKDGVSTRIPSAARREPQPVKSPPQIVLPNSTWFATQSGGNPQGKVGLTINGQGWPTSWAWQTPERDLSLHQGANTLDEAQSRYASHPTVVGENRAAMTLRAHEDMRESPKRQLPTTAVHAVKQEPIDTPIPAFKPNPPQRLDSQNHNEDHHGVHQPPALQQQGSKASFSSEIEASDKEKGDMVVQDFLKSLKLKTNIQSTTTLTAKGAHEVIDFHRKTLAPNAHQPQPSNSGASPIPWDTVAAALSTFQPAQANQPQPPNNVPFSNPFDVPQVPHSRPHEHEPQTIKAASILPTPPPSAPFLPSSSTFSISSTSTEVSHHLPANSTLHSSLGLPASNDRSLNFVLPTPCASSASPPPPGLAQTTKSQTQHIDSPPIQAQVQPENRYQDQTSDTDIMTKKGTYQNSHEPPTRPRIVESDFAAIQRLTREAWDIKRQITAQVAREAAIISELKERKSAWLPEPVKFGCDPSADMKDELARLRHELAEERRLRQEAENAIMDIRRECKEPFIVPSLLDAFLHISKLTTLAIRPVDSKPATTSGSAFSKDVKMDTVADSMSL